MSESAVALLDELETSLTHGSDTHRIETLRRVTDLFLLNAPNYSAEQAAVFDDVFEVLVRKIEISAKALLSQRLAPIASVPPRVIHTLAFDNAIEVAAPVLTLSPRLTDQMLVENARTKSQAHLLAISRRQALSPAVTDVLVDRGNSEVVNAVVGNAGAEFSDGGYERLIALSERDDDLATCVAIRPSIPRHHFVKLLAQASQTVRARLEALGVRPESEVSSAVREATIKAHDRSTAESATVIAARHLVEQLHAEHKLDGKQIAAFASEGKFEETSAALALFASVPFSLVETIMIQSQAEGILLLAKAIDLPWPAVSAILEMRSKLASVPEVDLNFCKLSYGRLKPATAQQALRFHRMRTKTG